ncbi:MAG: hypothetical protein KOO69_05505 [Victivallales bacterium]|nr:hypothetical protein [Victivallales bacterium]
MEAKTKKWFKLKEDYLAKLTKALAEEDKKTRDDIIEDVNIHLDMRFAELSEAEMTEANFQTIINEMGSPEDYLELSEKIIAKKIARKRRKKWLVVISIIILLIAGLVVFRYIQVSRYNSLRSKPPLVVKTYPPQLADDIPFGDAKVSVEFDQKMLNNCWSWCQTSGIAFPAGNTRPYYNKTRRVCYRNVVLEPGTVYYTYFNAPGYNGFNSVLRVPAKPYMLLFATQTIDGKPTEIPQKYIAMLKKSNSRKAPKIQKFQTIAKSPKIVKTFPRTYDNNVTPGEATMMVQFDQEMIDKIWAWCYMSKSMFPKTKGKPWYDETKKICRLKCKLKPGKIYWVSINSKTANSFTSKKGCRAIPYVIVFATRGVNGKPTLIPQKYLDAAKKINNSKFR